MADDLISRQAALDALDVLCQEHRYKIPGKAETYSQYTEAWQDALDRAEGAIGDLPSAQPEQRWIPVTERLPEPGEYYLVTKQYFGWNCSTEYREIDIVKYEFDGWRSIHNVLAWCPLPEPWKGERR